MQPINQFIEQIKQIIIQLKYIVWLAIKKLRRSRRECHKRSTDHATNKMLFYFLQDQIVHTYIEYRFI